MRHKELEKLYDEKQLCIQDLRDMSLECWHLVYHKVREDKIEDLQDIEKRVEELRKDEIFYFPPMGINIFAKFEKMSPAEIEDYLSAHRRRLQEINDYLWQAKLFLHDNFTGKDLKKYSWGGIDQMIRTRK